MRNLRLATLAAIASLAITPRDSYAGDGATIVMKSGLVLTIVNGYNQLMAGMKGLKNSGTENYPFEVSIEGSSFFINLGAVALICRDTCDTMTITYSPQATAKKAGG